MGHNSKNVVLNDGTLLVNTRHVHRYEHEQNYHSNIKANSRGSCSEGSSAYSGSDVIQVLF